MMTKSSDQFMPANIEQSPRKFGKTGRLDLGGRSKVDVLGHKKAKNTLIYDIFQFQMRINGRFWFIFSMYCLPIVQVGGDWIL